MARGFRCAMSDYAFVRIHVARRVNWNGNEGAISSKEEVKKKKKKKSHLGQAYDSSSWRAMPPRQYLRLTSGVWFLCGRLVRACWTLLEVVGPYLFGFQVHAHRQIHPPGSGGSLPFGRPVCFHGVASHVTAIPLAALSSELLGAVLQSGSSNVG